MLFSWCSSLAWRSSVAFSSEKTARILRTSEQDQDSCPHCRQFCQISQQPQCPSPWARFRMLLGFLRDEGRMDAMSASVSELNRRRWLQVWNASGVILMTIFRFRRVEIVCFFLPPEQVSLRCARNATIFRHFLVLPQAR
jgi:hypothetical protein